MPNILKKNRGIPAVVAMGVIGVLFIAWAFLGKEEAPKNEMQPRGPALSSEKETGSKNKDGYSDIESASLAPMLADKDFTLINVHIPYEGELEKTDAFIPYNALKQNLDKLPSDKSAKIVLYCRSGSMSTAAAKELVGLGYTNIYNLDGGMKEWEKQGNAIIRK